MDTKALRQKILDLAIRGKLVPQNPNDEPASVLLERIRAEKQQMVKDGKLKAKDLKNDTVIFIGDDNLHYEKFSDGTVECIESEIPYKEPNGWSWCRIKSIFTLQSGKNIAAAEIKNDYFEGSFPCYGGNDLRGFVGHYNRDGDYPIIGRQGALCGNIKRALGKFYATEHAVCVSTYANTDVDWACIFLKALNLNQYATATAQPGLAVSKIDEVLIPIPPQKEQKRIAVKLSNIHSLIDCIGTNKQDLIELIYKSKAKILDLAIRGKLVDQDPNDEPASVLLERIRNEKNELIKAGKLKKDKRESVIFRGDDNSYYERIGDKIKKIDEQIPFELPKSWRWSRLGNLSKVIQYGLNNSASTQGSHRLLRITDIQNGKVNWDTVPFTSVDEPNEYLLNKDDIVFARTGATVGKSFLIKDIPYKSVYASYLIRIQLMSEILPEYLFNFFNSSCYWNQITSKAVGVGQPNCNGSVLREILVPVPPKLEQNIIIEKIKQLDFMLDLITCSTN